MYREIPPGGPAAVLHEAIYDGAIVLFRNFAPMRAVVAYTRALLEAGCAPHPPTHIHRHLSAERLQALFAELRREYSGSPETHRLWKALFEAAGLHPEEVARDRLVLRFQPPHPEGTHPWAGPGVSTVGFHRDSWGTNLYAQVNWWAPVYPLSPLRTVAMYPHLWSVSLPNTSADFDMAEAMRRVREGAARSGGDVVPQLLEGVPIGEGVPVVIGPGSVIAFSAQHAHAGVPNHTDITRISVETRTLCIEDQRAGRGAPNVDGRARWMSPRLFRRLSDETLLPDVLGTPGLTPYEAPIRGRTGSPGRR